MILGLDTSTDELSLAVKDQDNNLLFAIQDKQGRRHGEVLVPTIAGLFANHGLSIRAPSPG